MMKTLARRRSGASAVLHHDRHFDLLAEVLKFESVRMEAGD